MTTIEDLKQKITTAGELKSVVKTMKALAAVSIHQYENAVESLAEYDRTLEMGWQILLQKHSQKLKKELIRPTQNTAYVVFGSDWGMCGQFNERIAEYTQKYLECPSALNNNTLILNVGVRIGDRLMAMGHNCGVSFNLPSSIVGITAIIQEIVLTLEEWRNSGEIDRIVVIYNRIMSGTVYRPTRLQIYPLSAKWLQDLKQQKWTSPCLPTFTMNEDELASALFRQYFFVSLYRACAESLKSENTSRLAAMQMAEKNISERLTELNTQFNQQRQTAITEELLDIVAGFEALSE
ncbi:F0F1 ATP synthase subunit gamma [Waterburya agarophytonicola K14]|uniref:F0F1 ATP synthase subunit gamma n=1 Tax=Waterburya agarophytonicola KI4 TaxID=2874699 RepID=A0A964BUZ8_9CYAN|nr:F0F1 ATP synthase subunit gamma [Waterburya agarophytonicola]MCC0179271.1 F0F1 ATP synthase subunit gamma [Waterburya agarophytonicola KI4]